MEETDQINLLHSPYKTTTINGSIIMHSKYLNNNFEIQLKQEIIKTYEKKCIEKFGYISKIYKIISYENGFIEPENQSCFPRYDVEFYCSLCMPINKREIICKITNITDGLLTGSNGPIKCIISHDEINEKNFYVDSNFNLINKHTNEVLKEGDYVKVLIYNISFTNEDRDVDEYNLILVCVTLVAMASQTEIEMYNNDINEN